MSEILKVPEGWEVRRINDIGEVITGTTPSTNVEEYYNGNIPFIGPVDFHGQVYISNTEKTVSKSGLEQSREIPPNSILTVCIGSTIGKISLTTKASCTNQQINSLICKSTSDYKFVFYAMKQYLLKQLNVEAGLQAVPLVNKTSFSKLLLPCPNAKEEQQKIAKILSTLDRAIEASQKLIAKEKNIKKGLMHDLLTNGIDENGTIRSPKTHKYKESELGLIPVEWESGGFNELDIQLIDGDRGNNYPKSEDFLDYGYCLFLNAKNVTKQGFKFDNVQFISKDKDKKLRKGKLHFEDFLLTTRGTVGNIAYYKRNIQYKNVRINSGMIILRYQGSLMTHRYLYIFFYSGIFEKQIVNTVFGSAQPQLTVKEIEKFVISFPKLKSEQQKIANILTAQDKKIETEEKNLEKLKELKKGLMHDLLSGKVRVKV